MKIQFVTQHSDEYSELAKVSLQSRIKYCKKHGYNLHVQTTPLTNLGPAWDKIHLIINHLKESDVVIWNGIDVVFMNMEFKVEDILNQFPDHSIILTTDHLGINSDNMIFRKSIWSEQFLNAILFLGYNLFKDHVWVEQESIIRFATSQPYVDKIAYVEQNKMNSYLNDLYDRPLNWTGNYNKGDWLIHLPGLPNEQRIKIIKERLTV